MKRGCAFLLAALLLTVPALASDLSEGLGVETLTDAAPPAAAEALPGLQPTDGDLDSALSRLGEYLRAHLGDALKEALRPLAAIVAVCLLCGVGESFVDGQGGIDAVNLGGCLAIAVIGVGDVQSVLALGSQTLTELLDFSRVLLPTLTGAAAASGFVTSATAAYAAAALFSDLLLTAARTLILPMICAALAAGIAAAVLGDGRLDGAVKLLQWLSKTLLKALVLAFTAYLGVTGVLAKATDAAAVKAAKSVLSTALPVVGKLLSDASEALVAGAGVLRGAVGVYGMLVCLAAAALPVLRLGARYLLFRAAAAVCSGFAGARQARLIDRLSTAYGMLLGLVGSAAAMIFLSIISLIRTVTP